MLRYVYDKLTEQQTTTVLFKCVHVAEKILPPLLSSSKCIPFWLLAGCICEIHLADVTTSQLEKPENLTAVTLQDSTLPFGMYAEQMV